MLGVVLSAEALEQHSGEPYNQLLARIALNAEVDIIILGGMGLKYDDTLCFRDTLEEEGALSCTILYVHTAADPVVECLLVPDTCLAVAEEFALAGKRVLVLLSDMTNFAVSLKEVAITMEQILSTRGYPDDLYSQLAARYEKAVDFEGAGSVTVLAVTTMPGDDVTHPIPDNTGFITEGQLYLPTLELKKQQLQREVQRAEVAWRERAAQEEALLERLRPWVKLLSSWTDAGAYVRIETSAVVRWRSWRRCGGRRVLREHRHPGSDRECPWCMVGGNEVPPTARRHVEQALPRKE